jgi:hypothetical protein
MSITPYNSNFIKRLVEEGVIPHECRSMTLVCAVDKVITMRLEVLVTGEQMAKIVDALIDNPEEAKAFAREIIFRDPVGGKTAEIKL